MEKKNIAITVLIVALVASGVGNIALFLLGSTPVGPEAAGVTLVRATSSGPDTLELVDAWDSASNDVLEQIIENLFFYDLFDEDLPRINLLAYSYYWVDTTHLQVRLREGIKFHDGTDFNAAAAKWNLDRLLFLTNCTGTNTEEVAHTQSLWMFPDGTTPIIASVATVGTYNITITLNGAYSSFLNLLTYINSGMISPTAHAAEAERFIDLTTGHPVGTGPFTFDSYVPNVEVRMKRWDQYWMGPANFETVIYSIYSSAATAHNAFLGYTVDWNAMASDQNLALYEADPKLTVKRYTQETGRPSLVYQYLGFNNVLLNKTFRQAMAYTINYTYVIDELRLGNAFRAVSPISPGFGGAYNATVVGPTYNVAYARSLMQSMGFGAGYTEDWQWRQHAVSANATTPFLSVINNYNIGNSFREDLFVALNDWFKDIGINVEDGGVTFTQFLTYLNDSPNNLGIYAIGWAPDYLDPFNMLDPLLNPISGSNSAQVNDTYLNNLMTTALSTTDETTRNNLYKHIQWYFATEGLFHAPLYHSKVLYAHASNLVNIPYNTMGALRIFPVYRGLYAPF